jgi:hypothetical protein
VQRSGSLQRHGQRAYGFHSEGALVALAIQSLAGLCGFHGEPGITKPRGVRRPF